jgi:hypothetical protein
LCRERVASSNRVKAPLAYLLRDDGSATEVAADAFEVLAKLAGERPRAGDSAGREALAVVWKTAASIRSRSKASQTLGFSKGEPDTGLQHKDRPLLGAVRSRKLVSTSTG